MGCVALGWLELWGVLCKDGWVMGCVALGWLELWGVLR